MNIEPNASISSTGPLAVTVASRVELRPLHLLVEHHGATPEVVRITQGPARLTTTDGDRSRLVADSPTPVASLPVVEPVLNQRLQPRLLLLNPAHTRARVNGQFTPLVAVLKEKDFVQFTDALAAHVTVLNRPRIGPPPAGVLGRECPVCRRKFVVDDKCYGCACGGAFHAEDDLQKLQCVQTRTECTCGRPVILTEGFSYQPE